MHNVFTKEINKISSSLMMSKKMQSMDHIESYAYETGKDVASEKEEIKCTNIIKRYKK